MFDVSFSELIVIAVVALIVIGPEKLPKVARTLGALTGRMQKFVAQVKDEVNREVRFDELQKMQQEIQETVTKTSSSIESSLHASVNAVKEDLPSVSLEVQSPAMVEKSPKKTATKKTTTRKPAAKKVATEQA